MSKYHSSFEDQDTKAKRAQYAKEVQSYSYIHAKQQRNF